MPPFFQEPQGVRTDSRLVSQFVGHPLMVDPRDGGSLRNIHFEFDDVENGLQYRGDDL